MHHYFTSHRERKTLHYTALMIRYPNSQRYEIFLSASYTQENNHFSFESWLFKADLKEKGNERRKWGPCGKVTSLLLPLKGTDTTALICTQLLCMSAAIPAFKYPGCPSRRTSLLQCQGVQENPTFSTEAKQNTNPAKARTTVFEEILV